MTPLYFITLTSPGGHSIWLEHREIKSVYDLGDGTVEVSGFIVTESFEEIVKKVKIGDL